MQTNLSTTTNTSAQAGSSAAKVADNQSGLSDMFTKLLVAQIKNQDPLSPSDPSQYVNQLATLSQTEAMQKMSSLTASNVSVLQSMQVLALGAQVGANVTVASDSVTLGNGAAQGTFTLKNAAADAALVLTGVDGVKHSIALGPQPAGDVPFSLDPAALGLPAGTYSIGVNTAGGEAASIALSGKISSVKISADGALLNVDSVGTVSPSAIVSFNGQAAALPN